jgi:hypothetical protein
MRSVRSTERRDCEGPEHRIHRRRFLEGAAAGLGAVFSWSGLFGRRAFAEEAKRRGKRCILLWLCGGPSQFETWDPKPGTATGGPFRSIPTKLPGVHVSELMPRSAKMIDKLAIVRSMSTKPTEHFQAIDLLVRGEKPRPPFVRPALGAVIGDRLGELDQPIPNFILLDPCPEGNEFKAFKAGDWSGWLGADHAPVRIGGEFRIPDIDRLASTSELDHEERDALRRFLSRRFENERRSPQAAAQNATYERMKGLMQCAELFDLSRLPERDRERYGPGTFGLHALLARHLVENGAPFVMVANGMPWDCHVFQHEIYQMIVPDLDQILHCLVTDLEERGLLEDTLVVAMGEFGRTPWINPSRGRDHYPNAWSLMMAGAGIRQGVVVGATDTEGVDVVESPFDERRLFATIFAALGIDPHAEFEVRGIPTFHHVEGDAEPIHEILAGGVARA